MRRIAPMRGSTRFVLLVAAATAGVSACKKQESAPADTLATQQTATVDTTKAAAVPQKPDAPGIPWGKIGHDNATSAYLRNVDYGPSGMFNSDIECHVAGSTSHIDSHLEIRPAHYAHHIDWTSAKGKNAPTHFYARVKVTGGNCPELGLKNGETGYLAVGPDADGNRTVKVYREDDPGVFVNPTAVATARIIKFCNKKPDDSPYVHVRPPECKSDDPVHVTAGSPPEQQTTSPVRIKIHEQGLWVSCGTGCCEAQF